MSVLDILKYNIHQHVKLVLSTLLYQSIFSSRSSILSLVLKEGKVVASLTIDGRLAPYRKRSGSESCVGFRDIQVISLSCGGASNVPNSGKVRI